MHSRLIYVSQCGTSKSSCKEDCKSDTQITEFILKVRKQKITVIILLTWDHSDEKEDNKNKLKKTSCNLTGN